MQCKEFASLVEQQGLSPLPDAAQNHLAACVDCQDYLADISSIVDAAKQFPAEVDPPQRVWASLRARLEAEGLLKEPSIAVPETAGSWLGNLRGLFRPRVLATAGVALTLGIAAFLQLHRPTVPAGSSAPVALEQAPQEVPQQVAQQEVKPKAVLPPQKRVPPPVRGNSPGPLDTPVLATAPSEDVYFARTAALNQAENDVPNADLASNPALEQALRKNLKTVNEFIAECEVHLKKHPQDTLAREYLNSAYQQKAELLAAMLDSGRSEQ